MSRHDEHEWLETIEQNKRDNERIKRALEPTPYEVTRCRKTTSSHPVDWAILALVLLALLLGLLWPR